MQIHGGKVSESYLRPWKHEKIKSWLPKKRGINERLQGKGRKMQNRCIKHENLSLKITEG